MSIFGLLKPKTAPQQDVTAPASPFVFGAGGARLTPEQMTIRQRQIAQSRAAGMDFSPVGHWTQGLARLANAWVARDDQARLDRDIAANNDARAQIIAALSGGKPEASMVAAALSDPDPAVAGLAEKVWERQNPKTPQLTDFQQMLVAGGIQPGTPEWAAKNLARATTMADPFVTAQLPGGRFYSGPQSQFQSALTGGGDPASTGSAGAPPATLPPDFDFDKGGAPQPRGATFP